MRIVFATEAVLARGGCGGAAGSVAGTTVSDQVHALRGGASAVGGEGVWNIGGGGTVGSGGAIGSAWMVCAL